MAPSTIFRSMAFSRATASAICRSSSLLALTVAISSVSLGLTCVPVEFQRIVVSVMSLVMSLLARRVLAVAWFVRWPLAVLAPAQRFGNQRVGENELCFRHVVDRQQHVAALGLGVGGDADARAAAFGAEQLAAEAAAAVEQRRHFDVSNMAGIAVEIGAP